MRKFRPDPRQVLIAMFGLGILVSGPVQAQEPDKVVPLHIRGAQLAMKPVQSIMQRLDLRWIDQVMYHPDITAFVSTDGLTLLSTEDLQPLTQLNVSWHPMLEHYQFNDGLNNFAVPYDAGIYFQWQQRW